MNHRIGTRSLTTTALMMCWLLMAGGGVYAALTKLDPPPSRSVWSGIDCSADGTRMAAVVNGGEIWVSTDAGATWSARASAGTRNWLSIALSDNGMRMAALEMTVVSVPDFFGNHTTRRSSKIWLSNDGGSTWTLSITRTDGSLTEVAISPDGSKIAAAGSGGIWISVNGGLNWTQRVIPAQTTTGSGSVAASSVIDIGPRDYPPTFVSATFSNGRRRRHLSFSLVRLRCPQMVKKPSQVVQSSAIEAFGHRRTGEAHGRSGMPQGFMVGRHMSRCRLMEKK